MWTLGRFRVEHHEDLANSSVSTDKDSQLPSGGYLIPTLFKALFSIVFVVILLQAGSLSQHGEDVTLWFENKSASLVFWFRLVNGTKAECISVKTEKDYIPGTPCEGFQHETFIM